MTLQDFIKLAESAPRKVSPLSYFYIKMEPKYTSQVCDMLKVFLAELSVYMEKNDLVITRKDTLGPAMAKALIEAEGFCKEGYEAYRKYDKAAIDVMGQCFIDTLATINRLKENV